MNRLLTCIVLIVFPCFFGAASSANTQQPKAGITVQDLLARLQKAPSPKPSPATPNAPIKTHADFSKLAKENDPQKMLLSAYEMVVKQKAPLDKDLCAQIFEDKLAKTIVGKYGKLGLNPLLCIPDLPHSIGTVRTNYLRGDLAGCAATVYLGDQKTKPHTLSIHLSRKSGSWKIVDVHHRDRNCPNGICSLRRSLGLPLHS